MKKKIIFGCAASLLVIGGASVVIASQGKKTYSTFAVVSPAFNQVYLDDSLPVTREVVSNYNSSDQTYEFAAEKKFEYDANGKRTACAMSYDGSEFWLSETDYCDAKGRALYSGDNYNKWKLVYNENGEIVREEKENSSDEYIEYSYIYDAMGRKTRVYVGSHINPYSWGIEHSYNFTNYEYDNLGRIIKEETGTFNSEDLNDLNVNKTITTTYLKDTNKPTTITEDYGYLNVTEYEYDENDNLIEKYCYYVYSGSDPEPSCKFVYQYDENNNLVLSEDYTYSYPDFDEEITQRIVREYSGNLITKETNYSYVYPSGFGVNNVTTYTYNNGLLTLRETEFYGQFASTNSYEYSYDSQGRCIECIQRDYQQCKHEFSYEDQHTHYDGNVASHLNSSLAFEYRKNGGTYNFRNVELKFGFFDTVSKFNDIKYGATDYGVALISKENLGSKDIKACFTNNDLDMSIVSFLNKEGRVDAKGEEDAAGDYITFSATVNVPNTNYQNEVCALVYFTYGDVTEFTYLEEISVKSTAEKYLSNASALELTSDEIAALNTFTK